jgi:hypothetical protein
MQILLMFVVALFAVGPGQDPPQDQTLTGCLRTGSSPTVFLLRGASLTDDVAPSGPREPFSLSSHEQLAGIRPNVSASASGLLHAEVRTARVAEDYLLVSTPPSLGEQVNHRIAVTGVVSDAATPPPGANAAEKALKKLSVKNVREVAANCSAPSR